MSSNPAIVTLTIDNFQDEVVASTQPVLVDFWAAWCGPCRLLNPTVDAIADEFNGRAKVAKLHIDDYPELASHYNIQAVPTLLLFQNGKVVDQAVGVVTKKTLAEKLNTLLQGTKAA